jgi:hypothetical protein
MSYGFVFLVLLLQFECDVDTVIEFEGGMVVVYEPSIFEESEVLEAEDFGLSFLLLLNLDVHERTAKNRARMVSCKIAHWSSVNVCLEISAMTHAGMALC